MTPIAHEAAPIPKARRPAGRFAGAFLAGCLFMLGCAEGVSEIWHPGQAITVIVDLSYGLAAAGFVLWGCLAHPRRPEGGPHGRAVIGCTLVLAFLLPVLLAYVALQAFPLSADEYGYVYLADTLRHGRLWNAPAPPGLRDILQTFYIPDQDGKRLSQYPPGWPAVLAVFDLTGLMAAANPALGLATAVFLALSLRELGVGASKTAALLVLSALAPFTLFNNASLFNHTMAGTCILAIAWLDLRNARRPALWSQCCIGLAFSLLLTTRYEAFAIVLALYVLDGVWRQRLIFVRHSLWAALGALPVVLLFGWYNRQITGSPFITTLAWGFPGLSLGLYGHGIDGASTPILASVRFGRFVTWWAEFACLAILPFAAIGLWQRVSRGTARWFDLLLPAVVLFFVFYPDGGGFQYGPRYWFIGWLTIPLTLGAAFPEGSQWSLVRLRFDAWRLALLQSAAYAGFAASYAVFAHLEVAARRESLRIADTAPPPALVLMGGGDFRLVPWQVRPIPLDSRDMTRNMADGLSRPIAYGRDLGEARTALLCSQVQGRVVWKVVLNGTPPRGVLVAACADRDKARGPAPGPR